MVVYTGIDRGSRRLYLGIKDVDVPRVYEKWREGTNE